MESIQPLVPSVPNNYSALQNEQSLVIQGSLGSAVSNTDQVDINFQDLYKSLSVTQKSVIDKLNEILKDRLPNGIQSLKPEDVTPEATADRIVKGSTAFFDAFAKQNPDLQGEALLNKFLDTIKSGIQAGYDDASKTLDDIGAFKIDGVKSGIEQTKSLVDDKLKAWESYMRKQLGIDPPTSAQDVTQTTSQEILTQAGGKTLSLAA